MSAGYLQMGQLDVCEVKLVSLQSNIEWKRWAHRDPLWAVCTERERQRGGAEEWTDQQFYSGGELDWRDFVSRWRRYGLRLDGCLEIGCGAGRIVLRNSRIHSG